MKTENANKARMIGNIDINSYEPYPKNPKIAKLFKEIGLAEELGSGVKNMVKYTKIYSGGIPEFKEDDIFRTIIPIRENKMSDQDVTKMSNQDRIIDFCTDAKSLVEIMEMMGYKHKSNFRRNFIIPLLENNKLEMTMPEKPNSKFQKYIKSKK